MKNLYMYDKYNLDIIPYFHMESGYILKYDIIPNLLKRYTNVEIFWKDFEARITTDDGIYKSIQIEFGTDYFKIYKTNRETQNQFTFLFFNGTFKTVRELSNCDSLQEYDWLLHNVVDRLVDITKLFNSEDLRKKYILKNEIYLETKFTFEEHSSWIIKLERFAKEIYKIYGYKVIFEKYPYHSLEFYRYGRVGNIKIELDNKTAFNFDYNQVSNRVNIMSNNRKILYEHEALLNVAKRLHDVKTYTIYDRKILQEESNNLGVNFKWQ